MITKQKISKTLRYLVGLCIAVGVGLMLIGLTVILFHLNAFIGIGMIILTAALPIAVVAVLLQNLGKKAKAIKTPK